MSLFHGMLLVDIADEDVPCSRGVWREDIRYRGMKDCWTNYALNWTLWIEDTDDGKIEVWVDYKGDDFETIGYYTDYNKAVHDAKEWMAEQ